MHPKPARQGRFSLPALLAVLALLPGFPAVADRSGQPVFERQGWPGAGIPVLQAESSPISVHETPCQASASRPVEVLTSRELPYDRSRVVTVERLTLQVVSDDLDYQCPEGIWIQQGDRLQYLQYQAEGYGLMGLSEGEGAAEPCHVSVTEPGAFAGGLPSPPATRWWVRVTGASGEPLGWVEVGEDGPVRVVRRRY